MRWLRTMLLVVFVACGGVSGDDNESMPDAGGDARPDAPPGCTRPSLDSPGLKSYVSDVVSQLAAAPRYQPAERTAARTYLMNQLTALGWSAQLHSYSTGANVVAVVPATMGSGQLIVVGAHFDTVLGSPGADDNASGVAVVLAVGRYLKDTPCRTAPVALVLFDQEELGLVGSSAYAKTLSPSDVRAVHTLDQVAWDLDGDHRFEIELPTTALENEWRAAAAIVGVPVTKTSTGGTDHQAFRSLGFAAVGLTEEYVGGDSTPYYHMSTDTVLSITPYLDYLVLASKLAGQVILEEVSP